MLFRVFEGRVKMIVLGNCKATYDTTKSAFTTHYAFYVLWYFPREPVSILGHD